VLHRKTIRRALEANTRARYARAPAGSKLDPAKKWIREPLQADPSIESLRLREMRRSWVCGPEVDLDEFVRIVCPRVSGPTDVPADELSPE
jgi:transposase